MLLKKNNILIIISLIIFIFILGYIINNQQEGVVFNSSAYKKIYKDNNIKYNHKKKYIEQCNNGNCKRIYTYYTSNNRASCDISNNKALTSKILQLNNIPVPKFIYILKRKNISDKLLKHIYETEISNSQLKYPLVIKPVDGSQGNGVITNIKNKNSLDKEFDKLSKKYNKIIIEEMVSGEDYRVLCVNGKVIDVIIRDSIYVVGNGKDTINELIHKRNTKNLKIKHKPTININWDLIEEQGYKDQDIIPNGKKITISNTRNYHNGSILERVHLKSIHPDNINIIEKACKIIDLKIAGVDFISSDISKSYKEGNGHIIEINSNPFLKMHKYPNGNKSKTIYKDFFNKLFES